MAFHDGRWRVEIVNRPLGDHAEVYCDGESGEATELRYKVWPLLGPRNIKGQPIAVVDAIVDGDLDGADCYWIDAAGTRSRSSLEGLIAGLKGKSAPLIDLCLEAGLKFPRLQ